MSNSLTLDVVGFTDTGIVREHNEDEFLLISNINHYDSDDERNKIRYDVPTVGSLFIVVDGMGGADAGEVASELAVQSLQNYFYEHSERLQTCNYEEEIRVFFNKAVHYSNEKISNHSRVNKDMMGIGATIVFALIKDQKAYIGWVGDCRAYLQSQKGLELLTEDHTLENELIKKGELERKEGEIDSQHHIVTQVLGAQDKTVVPGFVCKKLKNYDKLVLLTDGIHGLISDQLLAKCFEGSVMIGDVARKIIQEGNKAGGYDNMTLVISEVLETDVEVTEVVLPKPQNNTLKTAVVFTVIVVGVLFLFFSLML